MFGLVSGVSIFQGLYKIVIILAFMLHPYPTYNISTAHTLMNILSTYIIIISMYAVKNV